MAHSHSTQLECITCSHKNIVLLSLTYMYMYTYTHACTHKHIHVALSGGHLGTKYLPTSGSLQDPCLQHPAPSTQPAYCQPSAVSGHSSPVGTGYHPGGVGIEVSQCTSVKYIQITLGINLPHFVGCLTVTASIQISNRPMREEGCCDDVILIGQSQI